MSVFQDFGITLAIAIVASISAYLVSGLMSKLLNMRPRGLKISLSPQISDRSFALIATIYMLVFTYLAIIRHLSFNSSGFDLGQYDQFIWNSLNGRLLEGSFLPDTPTFLGMHFSPILIALVPLYAIWANPIVLLVIQTAALTAAGFPIYWFARRQVGRPLALCIGCAYFLFPAVEYVVLEEFHEIAFAVPVLALALFFMLRRKYGAFFVCVVLSLLIKEEIAFIVIALGLYILLVQRHARIGISITIFGAVVAVALVSFVIPFFRGVQFGSGYYYFGSGEVAGGQDRYAYLGSSLFEIIRTIVIRPDIVFQHIFVPDKIEYLLQLGVPLALLPLAGLEVAALTIPTFGYSLLSTFSLQYSIRFHYSAPLIPLLFFAAIVGLRRAEGWTAGTTRRINRLFQGDFPNVSLKIALGVLIFSTSVASYYYQAPGPFAVNSVWTRFVLNNHTTQGYAMIKLIPKNAVVVAQTELAPHLSDRRYAYEFPSIPDYRQAEYVIGDKTRFWYAFHKESWDYWLDTGYFETIAENDGYFILKRREPQQPLDIHFENGMTLVGYSIVLTDTLRGGETFRPIVEWRAEQAISNRYAVTIKLIDAQGHLWAQEDREPDDGFSPTDQWKIGKIVGDQYTLNLPPTMPAGEYRIVVSVHELGVDKGLDAFDLKGNRLGTEPVFATLRVEKDKASYTASYLVKIQPMTAYFVDMGEMRFLGYAPPVKSVNAGGSFSLGIYWRAREKPRGDYEVAVQLRDQSGRVAFEQVSRPAKETYPTTEWTAGEVLLDWHDFNLPTDIVPGKYQIFVVLRDSASGRVLGQTTVSSLTINR